MSSAWENFFAATAMLANAGPIKHRLAEAYRTHLANIDQDDLPKELREEFSSLSTCMSCVRPMRGETAVQATVRKMSDIEAGSVAMRIVSMLGALARNQTAQRPKLRAVGED
jgi:hypothetical protein